VIIDRPITAACQSWQGCNSDPADGSTDWEAISQEAGVVKQRRASVVRRSCKGEGLRSAIVMRNGGRLREDGRENGQRGERGLYSRSGGEGGAIPEKYALNRKA
jgi:hypothetical protein